jgi:hypothetical protein
MDKKIKTKSFQWITMKSEFSSHGVYFFLPQGACRPIDGLGRKRLALAHARFISKQNSANLKINC